MPTSSVPTGGARDGGASLAGPRGRAQSLLAGVWSVIGIALLAVMAVVVGIAGAFVHRWAEPLGLGLAVGGAASVAVLARVVARTRVGLAVVAAFWLAPVLALSRSGAGDDLVITGDEAGLMFLFGGSACHAIAVGLGAQGKQPRSLT